MDERRLLRSAAELRALGHPLRIRLLSALQHDGPATATMLGRRLGESSGATSFHLRQLARYDLIREDKERSRGRQRWWEATAHNYDVADDLGAPEEEHAADALVREVLEHDQRIVADYFTTRAEYAPPWHETSLVTNHVAYLTPSEFADLSARMQALVQQYARADVDDRPREARRVYAAVRVVPWRDPAGGETSDRPA